MITISDKAKAISGLQQEIDSLLDESTKVSSEQFKLQGEYLDKMHILGNKQMQILAKVAELQDFQTKLFNTGK